MTPPGSIPMELARNLKVDSVARLEPTAPLCLRPDDTAAQAVALMRGHGVGCLLVSLDDRLVGIFTERDLIRRVLAPGLPLTLPLAACMTPQPVTVQPGETIGAAIGRMEQGGYRHLPVVDRDGRAVGVLSVKRVVHYLVEHFPSTVYNLPPDPSAFPHQPEGA